MNDASKPAVSNLAIGVWFGLGLVLTVLGATVIGIAAYDSESAGVTASYVVAGPVGFGWGASIGAVIGRLALNSKPTAAKLMAPGCGCGCAVFLAAFLVLFMVAIFPAL